MSAVITTEVIQRIGKLCGAIPPEASEEYFRQLKTFSQSQLRRAMDKVMGGKWYGTHPKPGDIKAAADELAKQDIVASTNTRDRDVNPLSKVHDDLRAAEPFLLRMKEFSRFDQDFHRFKLWKCIQARAFVQIQVRHRLPHVGYDSTEAYGYSTWGDPNTILQEHNQNIRDGRQGLNVLVPPAAMEWFASIEPEDKP